MCAQSEDRDTVQKYALCAVGGECLVMIVMEIGKYPEQLLMYETHHACQAAGVSHVGATTAGG